MREKLNNVENLTENSEVAQNIWRYVVNSIKRVGREDILENPIVLDLGGGMGEFSKNLNKQGINCVSLDIQDLEPNPGVNQVIARAQKMPFASESFNIVHERGVFDKKLYPNDVLSLLLEIVRVLKPKGILSIYDADHPEKEDLEKHFNILNPGKEYPTLWEKKLEE